MIRSILDACGLASGNRPLFRGAEPLESRRMMSTIHWDGGGDGVTLNDRFNWDCDVLPGQWDHAVVDIAAEPELRLTQGSFKVKQFTLNENLTVSGGLLSVKYDWSVTRTLEVSGGVVDGDGDIGVAGKLKWTGGKLTGCGDLFVQAPGLFVLEGGTLDLRRDVYNSGTTVLKAGTVEANDECGTVIVNKPGALFKAIGESNVRDGDCWSDLFLNEGSFVRDGQGTARFAIRFVHTGTMNVVSGELLLVAGGSNTGTRHVAEGGVLRYFGDYTHGAGSTLTGGGITIWQGGKHTIAADWTAASFLHVTNATIRGDATLSTDGPITFNSGSFEGAGDLVINPSGKIQLMTAGEHVIARDIVNNGTLIWNRGGLRMEGATITNNAGKFFYVQADATASVGTGTNLILNHGEIRKQLPTALGLDGVMLDNRGFVNVRNGSLTLQPTAVMQITGAELSQAVLAGGAWSVYGTASLALPGASFALIAAGASVTKIGPSAGFDALAGLQRNDGSLTIVGGGVFQVDMGGGEFVNAGTLTLWKGTTIRVLGDFVQTASGRIEVGIASHHQLGTGRLITADAVTLDGVAAYTLINGYTPSAGQSFFFLAAGSLTGEFAALEGPAVPGVTPSLAYLPGGVRLNFV